MEKADLSILKKRLSTYRTPKGQMRAVGDEVLVDLLRAWETWPGQSKEFYQLLGSNKSQMGALIKKAKKLTREGHYPSEDFKEIQVDGALGGGSFGMEMLWDGGRVIRFSKVEQLLEFLQKAKG